MTPAELDERMRLEAEKAPPLTPDALDLLRRLGCPTIVGRRERDDERQAS